MRGWTEPANIRGRAELLGALTRIFVDTVTRFYAACLRKGRSGAVVVVQRTSSDVKLNPHLHVVFLDGVFHEREGEALFEELPRLTTREVACVLERTCRRMERHLRRRGLLRDDAEDEEQEQDGLASLAASASSGACPPAGPEWRRRALPRSPATALSFDRPLCVAMDGFTLHAATRAGALDVHGREALLKYVLRPAIAQERVTHGPQGLVRIALKKPFADGTVAVDRDPLSLLSRLAASVPPPRFHTVRYAGVLASASKLRSRIVPKPAAGAPSRSPKRAHRRYRPWAELLKRTFGFDVLVCPHCQGRMRLLAMVTDPKSVTRFLRSIGEPTDAPPRLPARGPPYWKSIVLRRIALGDAA